MSLQSNTSKLLHYRSSSLLLFRFVYEHGKSLTVVCKAFFYISSSQTEQHSKKTALLTKSVKATR